MVQKPLSTPSPCSSGVPRLYVSQPFPRLAGEKEGCGNAFSFSFSFLKTCLDFKPSQPRPAVQVNTCLTCTEKVTTKVFLVFDFRSSWALILIFVLNSHFICAWWFFHRTHMLWLDRTRCLNSRHFYFSCGVENISFCVYYLIIITHEHVG